MQAVAFERLRGAVAALDAETDLLFREARAAGGRDPREAYAADALHALVTRGPRKATGATLVMDGGEGGRTEPDNLWRICRYHHRLKTTQGWIARGAPHRWDLVPPGHGPDP